MASTWSALKIELLETGQNSGSWGTLTNINLGDAVLGEAITGSATVDFPSDADVTITLADSATTQAARNLRLNITESSSGVGSVRNLILGSGCQIEKFYLVRNNGTGAKTIKNTSGTGISVPAGKSTLVYNDGTNVVDGASYFTSLTLGSALPIASGGTGTTSTTFANLTTNVTGTLPIANGGTGTTSTTFANLTTNVTGTLPVANGGTGITSLGAGVATFLGTPSSANLAAALTDETGSGANVFATSPTLVTPNLGTPTTLVLTSATGLPLSSGVTGILPVANGGTATATPSLVQGSGVTITGTWPNQTIAATGSGGTVTAVSVVSANGLAGTSSGGATPALTLSTSITGVLKGNGTALSAATAGTDYVAPGGALGTPSSGTLTNTTGLPLTTGVTGTLPIANGGTALTTTPTNGQLLIGNGTNYTLATLTQGSGISVTNASGSITIAATGGSGTVTAVSVTSANGFAGTSSGGATPALTLTTSITGVLKGNGTALSAATAGTDYVAPGGALGTPSSGTLTNTTGLPISTGVSGLGANVATFLGTPSSANLASAVTDETGSGALVFATSPTLVTPLLGTPTSGTLSNCTVDGTDSVGFRNIPQNAQTGSYTLVLADSGKHIYHASGAGAATYTIPANGSVAYPIGTAVTFINLSSTSISIAITTDTMYLSSAGTTGTRTLAQYGSATAIKVTSTDWLISGSGLT
jgi:hypothetical protein